MFQPQELVFKDTIGVLNQLVGGGQGGIRVMVAGGIDNQFAQGRATEEVVGGGGGETLKRSAGIVERGGVGAVKANGREVQMGDGVGRVEPNGLHEALLVARAGWPCCGSDGAGDILKSGGVASGGIDPIEGVGGGGVIAKRQGGLGQGEAVFDRVGTQFDDASAGQERLGSGQRPALGR